MTIDTATTRPLALPDPPDGENPELDASSDATRLLCAGVYLDGAFRETVLRVLTRDPDRYAAPAYGYDSTRVVAHAQAYRERRINVRILIGGLAAIDFLMLFAGFEAFFITFLIAVWLSWVAVFFERLYVHNVLTRYLRKTAPTDGPSETVPYPNPSNAGAVQLAPEQKASAGLVYYSGYKPFVGAGETTRHWAFPILLVPNQDDDALERLLSPGISDAPPSQPDVNVPDLLSYMQRRLTAVLRTELQDTRRIDQLEITRRWYRTAIAESRPVPPDCVDLGELAEIQGREDYGSPREYLCVHVGSWNQELVTSAFLGFDVKGQTLHTEFHACQLKPIRSDFHSVDFYPRQIGAGRIVGIAAGAAFHMVGAVLSIPLGVLAGLPRLLGIGKAHGHAPAADPLNLVEPGERETQEADKDGGFRDYGARVSIREIASHGRYHHYFQDIDSKKYLSIIERWVDQITLEYLASKGVDLTEFRRKRSVTLVNTGLLQTGGTINAEGFAVGDDATVTINTPQDAQDVEWDDEADAEPGAETECEPEADPEPEGEVA